MGTPYSVDVRSTAARVQRYQATDHLGLLDTFLHIQRASGGWFPPTQRDTGTPGMRQWLEAPAYVARWVAVADQRVVGHVGVAAPGPDVIEAVDALGISPALEVVRMGVDPAVRQGGVGDALLRHAMAFIEENGARGVLAVLHQQKAAKRLYDRHGWRQVGAILGRSGYVLAVLLGPARCSVAEDNGQQSQTDDPGHSQEQRTQGPHRAHSEHDAQGQEPEDGPTPALA